MPKRDFYDGLPLVEQIRKFADHHYDPENRHISKAEYDLLQRAADALDMELRRQSA